MHDELAVLLNYRSAHGDSMIGGITYGRLIENNRFVLWVKYMSVAKDSLINNTS